MKVIHALGLMAVVSGCGGGLLPRAGDGCSGNVGYCESSSVALFCESARYVSIQCRGGSGCGVSGGNAVTCDNTERARAGDACLQSMEGTGQCSAADANERLKCVNGVFQAEPCSGCFEQGGRIKCTQ
ncbi:MAG: hypothetical protein IPJ65_29460 [Archangiaceae bacterium]|nr:hypothetical protein [Archangiaceae bacterium]